jgi:HK97 family phage prohead protease
MPDLASRGALSGAPEVRSYPAQFEVRSLSGGKVELNGYASTFEQPYPMFDAFGEYSETVRHGAFAKTIGDGADVAYLSNHAGLTMARTASGSLTLREDSTGLHTSAQVNTTRGDVRDLVTAIEDGDVDQMSFGFRVVRQEWSPDYMERAMTELNLDRGDVSAVNFGANPATSISAQRSFRSLKAAKMQALAVDLAEGRALDPTAAAALARALSSVASEEDLRGVVTDLAPTLPDVTDAAYVRALALRDAHERDVHRTA